MQSLEMPQEKVVRRNGEKTGIDLVINNGTTYVAISDAQKILDKQFTVTCVTSAYEAFDYLKKTNKYYR